MLTEAGGASNILTLTLAATLHMGLVLAGLLFYVMSTHASGQRRQPSAALAWVLTIALLPYLGLPLYVLLGTRKFRRPAHKTPLKHRANVSNAPNAPNEPNPAEVTLQSCAIATLDGMGLPPPVDNLDIRFHANGQAAWDELVCVINSAQFTLDIGTFLLADDDAAKRLIALMQQRASSGVSVRLMLDAFGSWSTSRAAVHALQAAGVQVQWYRPLWHNPLKGQINLRNHRKLAIADGERLWSGGRNLAAEYFSGKPGKAPWVDLSFSIGGALAAQAQELFTSQWPGQPPALAPSQPARPRTPTPTPSPPPSPKRQLCAPAAPGQTAKHRAQLIPSGPDQSEDTFYGLLLTALYRAEQRVRAITPYFVPDDALLTALSLAARRGVKVELVVPQRSNHRLADIARARALRDLAAAGGCVLLAPTMVHAKVVLVDDSLAFCGSVNLDSRSLFLNLELMVAFYSAADIAAITHWADTSLGPLRAFEPVQPTLLRDTGEGLVRWLGFQI